MARINYIQGEAPNDPFKKMNLPGYSLKRGKIVPPVKASTWGQRDGDGKPHDPESGKALLDEALGGNS
jgi:hypothetical protein